MDQISTLEQVFSYKAKVNEEILTAMRQFDDASPAKEIAITWRRACRVWPRRTRSI